MGLDDKEPRKVTYEDIVENEIYDDKAPSDQDTAVMNEIPGDEPEVLERMEAEQVEYQKNIIPNNVYYKTKEAAAKLGVSEQTLRNYCQKFEEFLDVGRTPSGQRIFYEKDIKRLQSIQQIAKEFGFSWDQTKEFLKNEADPDVMLMPEKRYDTIMAVLSDTVEKSVTAALLAAKREQAQIEDKKYAEVLMSLETKLDERDKVIQQLLEENRDANEKILKLQELREKEISDMKRESQDTSEEIVTKIRDALEESKNKKRWSFPWNK